MQGRGQSFEFQIPRLYDQFENQIQRTVTIVVRRDIHCSFASNDISPERNVNGSFSLKKTELNPGGGEEDAARKTSGQIDRLKRILSGGGGRGGRERGMKYFRGNARIKNVVKCSSRRRSRLSYFLEILTNDIYIYIRCNQIFFIDNREQRSSARLTTEPRSDRMWDPF